MIEYSHCSICGGSFVGIGNVCPGCEERFFAFVEKMERIEKPANKEAKK